MSKTPTLLALALACSSILHGAAIASDAPAPLLMPDHPDAAELAVPVTSAPAPKPQASAPQAKRPTSPVAANLPPGVPRVPTIAEKQLAEEARAKAGKTADSSLAAVAESSEQSAPQAAPAVTLDATSAPPAAVVEPDANPLAMFAQPEIAPLKSVTLTDAEREFATQEETLLRQIRLMDLHLELKERREKLAGKAPAGPVVTEVARQSIADLAPAPRAAAAPAQTAPASEHPFRLVSIWGAAGRLRAEFLASGVKRAVAVGEAIEGGWVLEAVNTGSVVVRNGTRTSTVTLGQ